jgi:ubiquinone/menaquinone biosynthesis C-methylase UbiE
MITMQGDI